MLTAHHPSSRVATNLEYFQLHDDHTGLRRRANQYPPPLRGFGDERASTSA
jgi:hypothetical protein